MAKRTPPRSQAADASAQPDSSTPVKRSTRRATRTVPDESLVASAPNDTRPTTMTELPDIPEPGDVGDQALRSESMSSSPSDEDIRLRAYHRYLQRGASDGAHFDDWIEAEQELREKK